MCIGLYISWEVDRWGRGVLACRGDVDRSPETKDTNSPSTCGARLSNTYAYNTTTPKCVKDVRGGKLQIRCMNM